ncbi:MAG: hypothetical protein ACREBC_35330, partial [Pyrinomonadaceae bacterium]
MNPFDPHRVARLRPVAYMKLVVMKYLDNLIRWADSLFRSDTIETINEATQLYVLAGRILGRKPVQVKRREPDSRSYSQLSADLDPLGNSLVSLESIIIVHFVGTQSYELKLNHQGSAGLNQSLKSPNQFFTIAPSVMSASAMLAGAIVFLNPEGTGPDDP